MKGVAYLSRIPPFMNADYIRKQFSKRFAIARIYLEAEPEHVTNTRKKTGGNRKTSYVEGWVEFERKKDAKLCALALNGQLIGGKKRHNAYHDDTW
jgi:ESF2/ABP1 family protein